MAAIIEVKFYNTFLLKKTVNTGNQPIWDGSRGIPTSAGGYPKGGSASASKNWSIEESRIRGGYNNTNVDYGVKAYLVEDFPASSIRSNSLIYSGIFNSRTGINNTNVFSVGEDITKSADPANGSIQKLYAEDTNLIIFQESKVSRALIDKDAIYSAEGGGSITNINTTIGTIQPYAGKFGISKDPGSFAAYGYRKYFSDKNHNAILRLSMDGITEVSRYGMGDYFRDELNDIDLESGDQGVIVGGWDVHNKQYIISTKKANTNEFKTLSFDEDVLGWTSFFTYNPEQVFSLRNKLYTVGAEVDINNNIISKGIWAHYSQGTVAAPVNRGSFYGTTHKSSITLVFNPEVSASKVFQTINYEGSNGWQIDSFVSDSTGVDLYGTSYISTNDKTKNIYSYVQGSYDNIGNVYPAALTPPIQRAGFNRKENKYFSNLVNNSTASQGEILWGSSVSGIKGYFATVTISTDNVTDLGGPKNLFAVSSNYAQSSY
tara:strand:- start:500 stop:1966 length:1467 start_codon:yes stop_codon:yes gene_type:complete